MNIEVQGTQAKKFIPAFVLGGTTGMVVAAAINAALFVATSSFAFPSDAIAAETGAPVGLSEIVIATLVGSTIAVGGYALLRCFCPSLTRPRPIYGLAVVLLVLLSYGPFTIHNVGIAQIVVMQLMHVVAAIVPLYGMLRSEQPANTRLHSSPQTS